MYAGYHEVNYRAFGGKHLSEERGISPFDIPSTRSTPRTSEEPEDTKKAKKKKKAKEKKAKGK
jgi:hypothetical protein